MTQETFEQDPNMRAAEYVLGTLPADEAAKVAQELTYDRELQAEVAYWEEQLGQLGLQLTPIDPPAQVWETIRARTVERPAPGQTQDAPAPRRSSRLWQGFAIAASIVAVVLAGLLYVATSTAPQVTRPTYASMFYDKATSTGWLVTASAKTGQMSVMAMGGYSVPQGKELRLWVIPKGGKPIASGIVPSHGRNSWQMSTRVAQLLDESTTVLAVSMEVAGKPVSDGPQGPILWTAPVSQRAG